MVKKIIIKQPGSITELGGILKEFSNKVKLSKKEQEDTEAWKKHVQIISFNKDLKRC